MSIEIRAAELQKRVKRVISSAAAAMIPREARHVIDDMSEILAELARDVVDLRGRTDKGGDENV